MIYTKKELLAIAAPILKNGVSKLYATQDGNIFYENAITYANEHNQYIKGNGVIEFTLEDIEVKEVVNEPKLELTENVEPTKKGNKHYKK